MKALIPLMVLMLAAPAYAADPEIKMPTDTGISLDDRIVVSPTGISTVVLPNKIDPTKHYKLVLVKPPLTTRIKTGAKKAARATYVYTKKICIKTQPIVSWLGSVAQVLSYYKKN